MGGGPKPANLVPDHTPALLDPGVLREFALVQGFPVIMGLPAGKKGMALGKDLVEGLKAVKPAVKDKEAGVAGALQGVLKDRVVAGRVPGVHHGIKWARIDIHDKKDPYHRTGLDGGRPVVLFFSNGEHRHIEDLHPFDCSPFMF